MKLIVLAIPPLTAAGFLWVAREVHGRVPPTAFFALPFIYGFPFLFGFVNFTLSVALAFLAFGLWLRLGRLERTALREWLFVPISLVVFFCHTYGWGLLGLMCFSADAVRLHDRGRTWWRAGIEAALHTSVMALADPGHADLAQRDARRPDGRLVRLEGEMALDLFGAARPLEVVRHRLADRRRRWCSSTRCSAAS